MNSLILCEAMQFKNLAIDLAIAAIILLFFLWGLLRGYTKPLTALISWVLVILLIYFCAKPLGNLFINDLKVGQSIRSLLQHSSQSQEFIDNFVKYTGILLGSACIFIVVKFITMIVNIFIKKAQKPYKKSAVNRVVGGLLNIIKGVLWVFIILAILYPISELIKINGSPVIKELLDANVMTKFLIDKNPIMMLINLLVK